MYGTNIYVEVGEKLTVKDLLYGLMLRSGNDAAIVLATYVAESEENFVNMMNLKATEIGMNNTIFSNSHGLDDSTYNYSTAYDMALLSRYAYQNKDYRKIISTNKYSTQSSLKSYVWYNRMSLLNNYKYCVGGKNGYTPSAGKTLVSVAKKNSVTLSVVSLDDSDIYNNHENLYEEYFNKCMKYTIIDKDNFSIDSYFVEENVYLKKSFKYVLCEGEEEKISTLVEIKNNSTNNIVGNIVIKLDDDEIGRLNIYKENQKKEDKSIFQKFVDLFTR
jgi:D-alanyl-D-alanine carboxypeptidase